MEKMAQTETVEKKKKSVRERFDAFVDKEGTTQEHMETNCWNWTGTKNPTNGTYGNFGYEGKVINSHRVAYMLEYGQIPADKNEIMHLCDNSLCVRPDHLKASTHSENMKHASQMGRMKRKGKEKLLHPVRAAIRKAKREEQEAKNNE